MKRKYVVGLLCFYFVCCGIGLDANTDSFSAASSGEPSSTIVEEKTDSVPQNDATLCVDIGGTRIKVCILEKEPTLEQLQKTFTYTTDSHPYLDKKSLPRIFKRYAYNPVLFPFKKCSWSKVAVCVTGCVFSDGTYIGDPSLDLPTDLPALCGRQAECEFSMQNDAVCWASGALAYQKLKGGKVTFPCLAITLGTGIGIALCKDEETITNIELAFIGDEAPFSKLKNLMGGEPFCQWSPNEALGLHHFLRLFGNGPFKDEEMESHLADYNQRFQIFTEELIDFVKEKVGIAPQEIIVGGGYSRFIRTPEKFPWEVTLLNPARMEQEGVSPDILSLLGAKNLMERHAVPSAIPSFQELVRKKKAP